MAIAPVAIRRVSIESSAMSPLIDPDLSSPDRRILITGGVRSGKSRYAEAVLDESSEVTYVAAGPPPDPAADAEWAARVADHRVRRPAHWSTVETSDIAGALRTAPGAILIDCLGTWLTALIDKLGTWEDPLATWQDDFHDQLSDLVDAWRSRRGLAVAVTNEVGWGLVPPYRSGRVFTELLGEANQAMAAASDELIMIVAGRALQL
jgi:adenosylcobinamide kinase/adenosylcobinamide-phosphate guanylyltransferase